MKAGGASSLNPFAASYVPLLQRGVPCIIIPGPINHESPRGGDVDTTTVHVSEFSASTSQCSNAAVVHDEDFEMELTYLQMMFPKMADECLSHVYHANMRDLDATVDMLNQLEICHDDLIDKLPETLDIGDVPESLSVGTPSSTAETGPSTSAI